MVGWLDGWIGRRVLLRAWGGKARGGSVLSFCLSLWDAPTVCLSIAIVLDATSVVRLVGCAFHLFVCMGCAFRFV